MHGPDCGLGKCSPVAATERPGPIIEGLLEGWSECLPHPIGQCRGLGFEQLSKARSSLCQVGNGRVVMRCVLGWGRTDYVLHHI